MPALHGPVSGLPVTRACLAGTCALSLAAQSGWTEIAELTSRKSAASAYDASRGETILFGGHDGRLRDDMWRWDGSTWSELHPSSRPAARRGHVMAYDESRRELVVYGGSPAHGEAWRLRDTSLGLWTTQGQGCDTGHGVLTLAATDPLAIGESTGLELTNLAPHLAVLTQAWVGFDDQQWGGLRCRCPSRRSDGRTATPSPNRSFRSGCPRSAPARPAAP